MATTTAPTEAWHYPPALVELTVKAVSLLNTGKEGELDFFRGAGAPRKMPADLEQQVAIDRNAISKAEIARRVITRLNDAGDAMIGPRREILNRIVRMAQMKPPSEIEQGTFPWRMRGSRLHPIRRRRSLPAEHSSSGW